MPWEQGPQFAGADGTVAAEQIDLSLIVDLATRVDPARLVDYYRLVERTSLDEAEASELLGLTADVFAAGDPDLDGDDGRVVEDVLTAWKRAEASVAPRQRPQPTSAGDFGATLSSPSPDPEAAGFLDKLNPRNLVRLLTV